MNSPELLKSFSARRVVVDELLQYKHPRFSVDESIVQNCLPMEDEIFVRVWADYLEKSFSSSVFSVLRNRLPQFAFPICEGISTSDGYRNATIKGHDISDIKTASGLLLEFPEKLEMRIHQTAAGRIPVLIPGSRLDFVTLVRALSCRNEPVPVPDSMGQ